MKVMILYFVLMYDLLNFVYLIRHKVKACIFADKTMTWNLNLHSLVHISMIIYVDILTTSSVRVTIVTFIAETFGTFTISIQTTYAIYEINRSVKIFTQLSLLCILQVLVL